MVETSYKASGSKQVSDSPGKEGWDSGGEAMTASRSGIR
jgi:hypothetical protein